MSRIIVSLAGPDDLAVLRAAKSLVGKVAAVEIRLDLLSSFDLSRLLEQASLPLLVSYRPQREGGRYAGRESSRLETLRRAAELGAYAVDVEWDVAGQLPDFSAIRMVSRHFFAETPADLGAIYTELAATSPTVVKIAAQSRSLIDALRLAQLWTIADRPLVAIGMGQFGTFTRLLAPFFRQSWLTYAAFDAASAVAPGQLPWQAMLQDYYLDRLSPQMGVVGVLLSPGTDFKPLSLALNGLWCKRSLSFWAAPLFWSEEESLATVRDLWFSLGTLALWWPDHGRLWLQRGEEVVELPAPDVSDLHRWLLG